jgi:Flp pilus assembly protein TadD
MSRRRVQPTCQTPKTQIRSEPIDDDPIEALIRRSKRQRRKGETRTAVLLLQRACSMDEWRARTYTLLGALLTDVGKNDDAERALLHARWLRQRAGEDSRAAVTMRLIDRVRSSRSSS